MYLGDGWLGKYEHHQYTITVTFNKKEEYYLEKMLNVIEKLFNRKPSVVLRNSTYDLVFNSKELYMFMLDNFGQYSYGKKINEWVKYIPKEYKLELIKGYFDSDGSIFTVNKNKKISLKISFVSINLSLLESFQDILFSLDIISSLNKLRNGGFGVILGKSCSTKMTYNLTLGNRDTILLTKHLDDKNDFKLNKFNIEDFNHTNKRSISSCHFDKNGDFIYFRIKKINKTKYTGEVYNFETESHTFLCHHITTHNCDVSRGDSEDYSAISIIDFDEREQVVEYVGKMPPDDLASIAYKWAVLYSAFVVVDITGGMGVATSRKLQELGYKDMFIDGTNVKDVWNYDPKALEKIPGINFNNKRIQIVSSFEEQLRNDFGVRSQRLMNEINTFIYLNGRPDHIKGAHDDAIMSLAMALYVGDISFSQLKRSENFNKSMMESWSLSERTYDPNKTFYSYGKELDSIGLMYTDGRPLSTNIEKSKYQEYSWLFGKKP